MPLKKSVRKMPKGKFPKKSYGPTKKQYDKGIHMRVKPSSILGRNIKKSIKSARARHAKLTD